VLFEVDQACNLILSGEAFCELLSMFIDPPDQIARYAELAGENVDIIMTIVARTEILAINGPSAFADNDRMKDSDTGMLA
jgi:hypothetical protein